MILVDRDTIATMIPHAGAMCLLDGVLGWDETSVRCVPGLPSSGSICVNSVIGVALDQPSSSRRPSMRTLPTRSTAAAVGTGETYAATLVGYDPTADVAVLQLAGASHLPTVSFARAPAEIGQAVVAVGNAGGTGGTPNAVSGIVTGLDQSITAQNELSGTIEHLSGLIGTNVPIQAGDSGGPLVDTAGKVLGMNTAATSRFVFAQGTAEAFAIPIETVRTIGTEIERGQSSATIHIGPTAFLGVEATNIGTTGAVVVRVLPGTAATTIGLGAGDTIVSLGGHAIRSPTTLSDVLQTEKPGATIPIGWQDRFGQSYTATVTLTSGPPA